VAWILLVRRLRRQSVAQDNAPKSESVSWRDKLAVTSGQRSPHT
jgi:hypothetical protein